MADPLILSATRLAHHAQKLHGIADQAQNKNWQEVIRLAQKGASVNECGWRGFTALHFAAREGALMPLKVLLGARANVNMKEELTKHTALELAARAGQHECVTTLLRAGTVHKLGALETRLLYAVSQQQHRQESLVKLGVALENDARNLSSMGQ